VSLQLSETVGKLKERKEDVYLGCIRRSQKGLGSRVGKGGVKEYWERALC